jgi:hypothetical protein
VTTEVEVQHPLAHESGAGALLHHGFAEDQEVQAGPRRSGQSGLPGTQENNRVGLRLKGLGRLKGKVVTAFAGSIQSNALQPQRPADLNVQ